MKNKSYIVSIVLVAASLAVSAPAGGAADKPAVNPEAATPDRRAGIQARLKQLSAQLNLTDEQKEKLKPIFQEQFGKVRELRQNTALSREDKLAKLKELREDTNKKIEPILTAEQKEKWQKFQQRRAKRQEKE